MYIVTKINLKQMLLFNELFYIYICTYVYVFLLCCRKVKTIKNLNNCVIFALKKLFCLSFQSFLEDFRALQRFLKGFRAIQSFLEPSITVFLYFIKLPCSIEGNTIENNNSEVFELFVIQFTETFSILHRSNIALLSAF